MTATVQQQARTPALVARSATRPARHRGRTVREHWPIVLITIAAGLFRFIRLTGVSPNDFYDAAVRSMSMSLRNFFYGSFDPGGLVSIDKPAPALWPQVISVKLFGWSAFALKFPEALAGTLAVPVLYDAVRRAVGRPAAIGAAAALAVLPESVLTARSDTMDSVMMLLVLASLWAAIVAASGGRRRTIVAAGALMGLAFNFKLTEALVAAPALAVLFMLGRAAPLRRRLTELATGLAGLVITAFAWVVPASLASGHPWALGSHDGSAWNAMFVFNGSGKVAGTPSGKPGGPGPFRLLVSTGWHYDLLFGCLLAGALIVGIVAVVMWAAAGSPAGRPGAPAAAGRADGRVRPAPRAQLERAFGFAVGVWMLCGLIVFDTIGTVHARYLEAFAPALAITLGWGAASLSGLTGRRPPILATALALAAVCAYTFALGVSSAPWGASFLALAGVGAALVGRAEELSVRPAHWLLATLIVACALVFPVRESLALVRDHANDSLGLATAPPAELTALETYLGPRTSGLRYELAVDEPLALAPLILHEGRPILPLTSFGGIPLTSPAALQAAISAGRVRYGLIGGYRCGAGNRTAAGCSPAANWIRQHGIDVTRSAGLPHGSRLYLLTAGAA
jgi:4-amino-4-deoxy-L-arabinose transferase-like glycosyltransferase